MTSRPVAVDRPGAGPTDEVAELDPAWLSTALDVEVSSVHATRVGTGQMGQSWRLDRAQWRATVLSGKRKPAAGQRVEAEVLGDKMSALNVRGAGIRARGAFK